MIEIQRRERRPFKSAASRKAERDAIKILTNLRTHAPEEEKKALAIAIKALGGKLEKPAGLAVVPLVIGGETGQSAASLAPATGEEKQKTDPRITPAIAQMLADRPDITDKLKAIIEQSIPATVKIPQMKKLIADNPKQP